MRQKQRWKWEEQGFWYKKPKWKERMTFPLYFFFWGENSIQVWWGKRIECREGFEHLRKFWVHVKWAKREGSKELLIGEDLKERQPWSQSNFCLGGEQSGKLYGCSWYVTVVWFHFLCLLWMSHFGLVLIKNGGEWPTFDVWVIGSLPSLVLVLVEGHCDLLIVKGRILVAL